MTTRPGAHAVDARRRLLFWSPALLAGVAVIAAAVTTAMLYDAAIDEAGVELKDTADSQARLVEAILATNHGDVQKTLELLQNARRRHECKTATREYTLATREGDQIRWLLRPRHHYKQEPATVPFRSDFAEPMRRALLGQSGTMIGPDYRGVTVLAAHEPVLEAGWGVVAKIDMSELRAPYLRAGIIASSVVCLLVLGTTFLLSRMVRPVVRDLEESRDAAQAADHAKSDFLAAMSHELRTPLNAIIGFSRGMLDRADRQPLSDHQKSRLEMIHESGMHLLSLITDILDIAKVESGRMDIHVSINSPRLLLIEVHKTVVGLAQAKGHLAVRLDAPLDLPLMMTDADKVKQILMNLADNAVKFTEKGMVTLAAREEHDHVVFTVADTGIGIPENQWGRLFEKYFQIRGTTTQSIKGTGLGLPIARAYTELLGGSISFTSQVGQGSTFVVRLPQRIVRRVESLQELEARS